jgi:preprotein translocase subunit SecB
MTKKYKILAKYIKDISGETPDLDTYLHVREKITKYKLNVDINSKPLKNKIVEINTSLKFEDKNEDKKKAHFEILFSSIVKIDEEVQDKKELQKIILCDVQIDIYPDLEKSFLNLLHNSGYTGFKFEKKIDFVNLYNKNFN